MVIGKTMTESDESNFSIDIENTMYETNDSKSDIISLSDLTAPNSYCLCASMGWPKHFFKTYRRPFGGPLNMNTIDHFKNELKNHDEKKHLFSCVAHKISANVDKEGLSNACVTPENANKSKEKRNVEENKMLTTTNQQAHTFRVSDIGRALNRVLWNLMTTFMITISLSFFIECGSRIYVFQAAGNSSNMVYTVKAPSFVAQIANAWTVLIYPAYILLNYLRNCRSGIPKYKITNQLMIIGSDQPTALKVLSRCMLLSVFWQTFLNCCVRSLQIVPPVDCAAILSVYPCFYYLLCWIVVHRRFSALRVIAFILASSGVILNIYSDQRYMWFKCLTSFSLVSYSMFTVTLKRIISKPTFGQFAAFHFVFGIFNLTIFWPIFVISSFLTSVEPIQWNLVPWRYFLAVGFFLLLFILSNDLSSRYVTRAIRMIQPLGFPMTLLAYHLLWLKCDTVFNHVRIGSFVLITVACLMNALPHRWMKALAKIFGKHLAKRTQPQAGKRTKASFTTLLTNVSGQTNATASQALSNPASRPVSAGSGQQTDTKGKFRNRFGSILLRSPSTTSGTAT